ncbi:hypothetical protein DS62_02085 [Smithella sp. SC_K08D17]|nr:hypothetical protein KD27_02335 [Smithella sp. D17]KIE17599.1 hypothetical protein DS62_02085 [Smithella sp. SC_K08D17]
MKDFTLQAYRALLKSLNSKSYLFRTFSDFIINTNGKVIVLRHDVDKLPENSLVSAKLENEIGIKGSYYFRAVPESWDENIIKEISALGHEIGYHYENLSEMSKTKSVRSEEQLFDLAFDDFRRNLEKLRALAPVSTICMHGSPLSKWDSRDLWKKYDYKSLGIVGEPYFDIDFSKAFYLTDTGRRWDGFKVSRRDRIPQYQDQWEEVGLVFHSTQDIIDAANNGRLPSQIMITVHPQRWTDNKWHWMKEYLTQNAKNQVKRLLVK